MRCNFCGGFLEHSFIATNGIDVYRCTREGLFNENGRYFITTAAGGVEVVPRRIRREWSYEIVDTERRRLTDEANRINEELEARQKLFRKNMSEIATKLAKAERHAQDED